GVRHAGAAHEERRSNGGAQMLTKRSHGIRSLVNDESNRTPRDHQLLYQSPRIAPLWHDRFPRSIVERLAQAIPAHPLTMLKRLLGLLLFCVVPATAQDVGIPHELFELDNGLRLIVHED